MPPAADGALPATTTTRPGGYPTGDAAAWRARYQPFVATRLVHAQPAAPRVSVVLVAWNTPRLVVPCLEAIRRQQGFGRDDLEVILVDNGGLAPARAAFPGLVDLELRLTHNVRLCPARNLGVAEARAPLVAFLDDDGLIEPDYLQRALPYFTDPTVAAVRSRIVWRAHRYFTLLASHYDRGPQPVADCLVTEGSSLVRRDRFLEVGGFAEELAGHEGIDLTFRLQAQHPETKVLYAPDVVMRHDYVDSWAKFFRKSSQYSHIDQTVAGRGPELAAFLRGYFGRRFATHPRRLDERLALLLLRGLQRGVQRTARLGRRLVGESRPA